MQIVLLSGSVSSGKTTLSEKLRHQFEFHVLKTKEVLRQLSQRRQRKELEADRRAMQLFGERLDRETQGKWVLDALTKVIRGSSDRVIVDSVWIPAQIRAIRQAYGFDVVHIHLSAPETVLAKRYQGRKTPAFRELKSYAEVERNPTEGRVGNLAIAADVVIDTALCTPNDVLVRAATHLGLYARDYSGLVDARQAPEPQICKA